MIILFTVYSAFEQVLCMKRAFYKFGIVIIITITIIKITIIIIINTFFEINSVC